MILLDTNVVSAFVMAAPPSSVEAWVRAQNQANLYLSSVAVSEIAYGLACMPEGRRKQNLSKLYQVFLDRGFRSRILDFDFHAANAYGELCALRRSLGRPISVQDAQIAAIARVRGATVATRNIKDFEHLNLSLINPYDFLG